MVVDKILIPGRLKNFIIVRETFLFKRSNITLFLLGFMLLAILFSLKLVSQRQEVRRRAEAATILSFNPSQATVSAGEEITLTVDINTGNNQVTAADVTINYDPAYLEGVSFTPGTYLPVVLSPATLGGGQAQVVLGSTPAEPMTGQGTLATLKFKALAPVTQTDITYAGSTEVAAIGETGNVLTASTPAQIQVVQTISSPVPTPTPTPISSPAVTPTPNPTPSPGTAASPTPVSVLNPCNNLQPSIPSGVTASALSSSSIHISWQLVANTTHYGLVYGNVSKSYIYGAANVGNVNGFTVNGLAANKYYYFAVFSVNDCGTRGYSAEASGKTPAVTGGAPVTYVTPSPTPQVKQRSPSPAAKTSPSPNKGFVLIDPNASEEGVLTQLTQPSTPSPKSLPAVPKVSVPPRAESTAGGAGALLTPLGGILLIMAAILATFFFFKMRG